MPERPRRANPIAFAEGRGGGRRRRDLGGRSATTSNRRRPACCAISARSPRRPALPVVVYNIPGRTGANMLPETLLQLAQRPSPTSPASKNRAAISGRSRRSCADRRDGFRRLGGRRSSVPAVLGDRRRRRRRRRIASLLAASSAGCSMRFARGASPRRRQIHASLLPLFDALFATTNPIPVKWAMNQAGFHAGSCRLPLDDMPGRARAIACARWSRAYAEAREEAWTA